jgi:hypothetical protein
VSNSSRSGWRGLGSLGTLFLALCAPGLAQSTQNVCNVTAEAVTIRAGGGAERTADVVVVCTGGFTTPPGQTVQSMTWVLSFNQTVTSRPLAAGWSDALLVVNEPQAASQVACLTVNGICATTGSGSSNATYSAPRPNVFQSEFAANVLTWRGVPFDPPGTSGTLVFRFTNLRVPAPGFGNVTVTVGASGQIPILFNNATQIVATSQTPVSGSVSNAGATGGRLSSFTVNVVERFSNVLKAHSAAGPLPSVQSSPGGVPHSFETGFYNPNLGTSPRGILSFAGLPDNGTRVLVGLSGVPTTATVSVPAVVSLGSTGVARLIAADAAGIGGYEPAATGTLPNDKGNAIATYEITQSSAVAVETLSIPFTINWAAGAPFLQALSGTVALAPLHASQIADGSPIPRFNNPIPFTVNAPLAPLNFVTTSLPVGAAGTPYSQAIEVTGGLPPYSYVTTPLPPVPGLTLSAAGVLTGTPPLAGTFGFSLTVRDSAQGSSTRQFSLTVAAAGSLLQTSVSRLDFSAILGGAAPGLQVIRVTSSQTAAAFVITVDGGTANSPAPAWLQGSPRTGTTPGLVTVSVNPAGLPEGTYTARIRISIPGNPNLAPADVIVTLVVKTAPAVLESFAPLLSFSMRGPGSEKRQGSILLRNGGGGGALPFSASVLQRSSWISSIVPVSGAADAQGTQVKVTVDIAGLAAGIYRDVIRFTSAINTVDVPVIVRVIPLGPVLGVSPAGVRFSMREGARTLAVREVRVFNRDATSNAPWAAELIRGGEHFSVAGTNGTLSAAVAGIVKVSVRAESAGLPAGAYYGLLRVTAPGAAASPAYVTLVLQVKPAAQAADLDLDAGGLVFTALTGGQATRRTITLNAASQLGLPFQAAASTLDASGWLNVTPASKSKSAACAAGFTCNTKVT